MGLFTRRQIEVAVYDFVPDETITAYEVALLTRCTVGGWPLTIPLSEVPELMARAGTAKRFLTRVSLYTTDEQGWWL